MSDPSVHEQQLDGLFVRMASIRMASVRMASVRMASARVASARMHGVGVGGAPLLCLHGIGGSADSFAPQLDELSDQRLVIAWDAPGYARSADREDRAEPPGLADYVRAAAGVLRRLTPAPAHVLGVSWGGVIAVGLAVRHPELVRSLILADSSRGSGRSPDAAAAMRERVREFRERGPLAFAARRGPRLVSPDAEPLLARSVTTTMAASIRSPGYPDAAESMATADHTEVLREVRAPALVLVGEHDTVTGIAESEAIAAGLPHARLVVVPGAGHAANQERPAWFNLRVRAFLGDVEAGPPDTMSGLTETEG